MALVVGTNSWITVLEADDYFTNRIGSTDWFDLPEAPANPGEDAKETMLVSAYYWLTQSSVLSLSADLTDANVKHAQAEAALFLLGHYSELDARRAAMYTGVTEFELSKRREKLNLAQLQIPDYILGLLNEYSTDHAIVNLSGDYNV